MSQKLFSVGKVGLFVDAVALGKEKRTGGEEATVLKLTLRCEPFTRELAAAIDDGLGGDHNVLASIFKLNSPEPKPHLERVNLSLDCPRQRMDLYASPDTDSSRICFDQVKISGFYVRAQKDSTALTAIFSAAFGPFSKDELEAATQYFRNQMFVSFVEAEPSLMFDEDDQEPEARLAGPVAPAEAPMWDETEDAPAEVAQESIVDREKRSRPTAKRGSRSKRQKHDPEAERAEQLAAGRSKTKSKANGAAAH